MRKLLISLVLILLCFIFSGCFRGEVKVNINEDGSSDLHYQAAAAPLAGTAEMLQSQIKDLEKSQFKIERFTEGDWIGFRADKHFQSVSDLNGFKLFSGGSAGTPGIIVDKGWFYDNYSIHIVNDISVNQSQPLTNLDKALLAQMSFKMIMNLPVKPESHNAGNISSDGRTLEWNLSFTKENQLEATAKVWHYGNIALTVIIPLVVLAAFYFQRRKYGTEADKVNMPKLLMVHPVIVGVIVAVLISGAGAGYYAVFQPKAKPAQSSQQLNSQQATSSQNNTQQAGKEIPAKSPAASNRTLDPAKSLLRGKWNGMSDMPDKGKNSISMMVTVSGDELLMDLSMAGEGTANRAKATAKINLADINTGTFSYQDNWKNQGTGSLRIENGKLILEIQGATPDRKGWGIYPGKFTLNRWVD